MKPSSETPIQSSSGKPNSWIVFGLAALLAIVLLAFALQRVSWEEMVRSFRRLNPAYLAIGFLMTTLTLYLRGLRWGVLVSAQKPVGGLQSFLATTIGYMGNTFLPARAGELLRSIALGRMIRMDTGYILATALTERVIDMIALVIIGTLVSPVLGQAVPAWLPEALKWMGAAGFLALAVLFFAYRLEGVIHRLILLLRLPGVWDQQLRQLISQFLLGSRAFVHTGRASVFLGMTVLIWLVDAAGNVIFSHGMGLSIQMGQALLFLCALGLSSALPSTPGYIGIYQFVAVTILPLFGWSESQALSYILLAQAIHVLTVVFWGTIGMLKLGMSLREFRNE